MFSKNQLSVFTLFLFFSISPIYAQITINEFSAANKTDHADNYGEFEDWIELHNAGAAAVNLTGYYLSDKNTNPTKWEIPSGTIAPGGTMIFYASGRDEDLGGFYHTNFKITQTKQEWVVLSDATGTIIDSYEILDPMQENHSIGRTAPGATTWGFYTTPTPNALNSGTYYDSYAAKPDFALAPGFYTGAQSISFNVPAGVDIYYTTNGDIPDATSTLYTVPFNIANTTLIRAVAIDPATNIGMSFRENNTYFIDNPHTLPVISVGGDFNSLFTTGNQIKNSYEYFGGDNFLKFELEGDTRRHGNDSWFYPQKGMRFYARDDYGYANRMEHEFFPNTSRDKFKVMIMKAGGSDNFPSGGGFGANPAHMRDGVVQTTAINAEMNVDCRSYTNAVIYINGQYWGIYELRERIDDDYCNIYYNQDVEEEEVNMLEYWGGLVVEYGNTTNWDAAYNFVVNNNLTVQANYDTALDMLDKWSFIDYFIVNTFFVNSDWLNWNTKWWQGTGGAGVKWRYTLWDMDNTFDLGQNYTGLPTTGVYADPCDVQALFPNNPNIPHVAMFNKLFENDDFFQDYLNRYADLLNTEMHKDSVVSIIDDIYNKMQPEMTQHTGRWGGTVADWTTNVNALKDFANTRWDTVMGSLVDCYSPQVTGIYELLVDVEPPLTGTVKVNTVTPSSYPWSGAYFGGIDLDFKATPVAGYIFDHWETNSMVINPNMTVEEITATISTNDTLRAVFVPDRMLTIDVEPANAGTVTVDGTVLGIYPWTDNYIQGSQIGIAATAANGYSFSHWETLTGNVISPSTTDITANLDFQDTDTLIAHFDLVDYTITVKTIPINAGSIWVDGTEFTAADLPYSFSRNYGDIVNLETTYDSFDYNFIEWQSQSGSTISPSVNDETITLTVSGDDEIDAVFETKVHFVYKTIPENAGELIINENKVSIFPHLESYILGTIQEIHAEPFADFEFQEWITPLNNLQKSSKTVYNSLIATVPDTIYALFRELDINPEFPTAIYPGSAHGNGTFLIPVDPELVVGFDMKVYDRWGKQLFHSEDPEESWDGTIDSKIVSTDSYIYEIRFVSLISNKEHHYQGTVTVIR